MTWTVAAIETTCGRCDGVILVDQPLAILRLTSSVTKVRCRECAGPVDQVAVDAARLELAQGLQAAAAEPAPSLFNTRPTRVPMKRRLAAFTKLSDAGAGFDPRRAAANDPE